MLLEALMTVRVDESHVTLVAQSSLGEACRCRWEHTDGVTLELVEGKPHVTSVLFNVATLSLQNVQSRRNLLQTVTFTLKLWQH